MKMKNKPRVVKFPENKDIARKLRAGDRVIIARYAGLQPGTIRDMMSGFRRITDPVARAIIRLMNERQELDRALDEIANQ
jgi:hypothetical protein